MYITRSKVKTKDPVKEKKWNFLFLLLCLSWMKMEGRGNPWFFTQTIA